MMRGNPYYKPPFHTNMDILGRNASRPFQQLQTKQQLHQKSLTDRIIDFVTNKFSIVHYSVWDEKDLEVQLTQALRTHFHEEDIVNQVVIKSGKIDLMIGSKFGIECKVPHGRNDLRNAFGQISDYVATLGKNNVLVVIVHDPSTNHMSGNDLESEVDRYKEATGLEPIVIHSALHRRKKR